MSRDPDDSKWSDDEGSCEIAQPPRAKDAAELRGSDHMPQPQRNDAERRADQRADGCADHQREDVPDAFETGPTTSEPQEQHRGDHDLEGVSDRLSENGAPRLREVGHKEIAHDNAWPEAGSTITSAAIPTPTGGHSGVTLPWR